MNAEDEVNDKFGDAVFTGAPTWVIVKRLNSLPPGPAENILTSIVLWR